MRFILPEIDRLKKTISGTKNMMMMMMMAMTVGIMQTRCTTGLG
jgi:hypothetical protein